MPILKNKFAISVKKYQEQLKEQKRIERLKFIQTLEEKSLSKEPRPVRAAQLKKLQEASSSLDTNSKNSHTSNNIMKNYCRALIMFAISDLAVDCLEPMLEENKLDLEEFRSFLSLRKAGVNCIKGLRELLLITAGDNQQTACFKKMFQKTSVVFLKLFSVKWIFNSKVKDRMTHLRKFNSSMPILKKKIAKARENDKVKLGEQKREERERFIQTLEEKRLLKEPRPKREVQLKKLQETNTHTAMSPKNSHTGNNIMKNYSRALVMFAISDIAVTCLQPLLERYKLHIEDFRRYINQRKTAANCIKGIRELLLVSDADNLQIQCFKEMFQMTSIVFLKFFSVNWIFNSKINEKMNHLKYRFKILRRVQNPAYFTYLEDFAK